MTFDLPRVTRRGWLPAAAVLCAACASDAVVWSDREPPSIPIPPPSAELGVRGPDAVADSLLRDAVQRQLADGTPRPLAAPATLPGDPTACPTSLRVAAGPGTVRVAVWWAQRPDRSSRLLASRSTDGGTTWGTPLSVDTLDRSTGGCDRPAPAVAVDSANGFVHVVYSMRAPEGEGVFYAHQMDPRAAFEPPQVVVYGDRPSAVSVASDGDLLAVAYEDPNTAGRPFVSLAISRTAGHTIAERLAVSGRSVASVRPAVAVRGRTLAVGWVERPSPRTLSATEDPGQAAGSEGSFLVLRRGTVR
jgi:hypothetical protein